MRIALGGIVHETHGFSGVPTTLADFKKQTYYIGEDIIDRYEGSRTPLGGVIEGIKLEGFEAVPLMYATATPAGLIPKDDFLFMVDELISRLISSLPLDGVILTLHGAMLADGYDDCEGYILRRVREAAGNKCRVVSTLDLHSNIGPEMLENADIVVGYDENPHMDMFDRGLEAVSVIKRLFSCASVVEKEHLKLPLLLSPLTNWTEANPLKPAITMAHEFEKDEDILNITVSGGFAYADTPYTGVSVLVQALSNKQRACQYVWEIAKCIWENRQAAQFEGITLREAIAQAAFTPARPVILADMGDNIGGGASGDATFMLRGFIDYGMKDCLVTIYDPEAVQIAVAAGEGGIFDGKVGGKTDRHHGEPVKVVGIVKKIIDGKYRIGGDNHFAPIFGTVVDMGLCALIKTEGISIILTTRRTPPGDIEQIYCFGLVPENYKIIAVKAAVAFRSAYSKISKEIYFVNTPGLCTCKLSSFNYQRLPRPIYPLDVETIWNECKQW